jgi:2',3'-cyclic-nucleotide 2'-phosphodiesterase (5'-nucleotidase family)
MSSRSRLLLALVACAGCPSREPAPVPVARRSDAPPPADAARPPPDTGALAAVDARVPEGAKRIAVLYSSNLDGEYDSHPLGGLARRATAAAELARAVDALVQVDAGDSLLPRIAPAAGEPPPDPAEVERRVRLLASGLGRLQLAAFTPGETDLQLGPARLKALAAKAAFPVVSSNLLTEAGKPWFQARRMVRAAGLKIGIFGVTTMVFEDAEKLRAQGGKLGESLGAAQGAASMLREEGADIVIGLCHLAGGLEEARQLAGNLSAVDVLVLGHDGGRVYQRVRSGDGDSAPLTLVEARREGIFLGQLDLRFADQLWTVGNRFLPLDSHVVSDPKMLALVRPYIVENRRRVERKLPVGLTARAGSHGELANATDEKWTYASTAACALCHPQAKEQFLATEHAYAVGTLESKGRQHDPQCLRCHSTGFDRPGGTRNLATAATFFPDVGCESCHGPSSKHIRSQNKTGTSRAVAESICRGCHTEEQSPGFDFAQAIKEVLGKGHGEAFLAARPH